MRFALYSEVITSGGVITPPEATNMGPGFNRGSGGVARGCCFEERVGCLWPWSRTPRHWASSTTPSRTTRRSCSRLARGTATPLSSRQSSSSATAPSFWPCAERRRALLRAKQLSRRPRLHAGGDHGQPGIMLYCASDDLNVIAGPTQRPTKFGGFRWESLPGAKISISAITAALHRARRRRRWSCARGARYLTAKSLSWGPGFFLRSKKRACSF